MFSFAIMTNGDWTHSLGLDLHVRTFTFVDTFLDTNSDCQLGLLNSHSIDALCDQASPLKNFNQMQYYFYDEPDNSLNYDIIFTDNLLNLGVFKEERNYLLKDLRFYISYCHPSCAQCKGSSYKDCLSCDVIYTISDNSLGYLICRPIDEGHIFT